MGSPKLYDTGRPREGSHASIVVRDPETRECYIKFARVVRSNE